MQQNRLFIGTSGRSYRDWKGIYYPEKSSPADWLEYYAHDFNCTEINTSFYRLPRPQTPVNRVKKTPEDFLFCPKISRFITHIKKLNEPEATLPPFFEVFGPVKGRPGPVLIQLPPSLGYDRERTGVFFSALRARYSDYDFALEVRHDTWMKDESFELMKEYGIAFVISQSGVGFPYAEEVTAKQVYMRFHGPGSLYASRYHGNTLRSYAGKIRKWLRSGHTVWAFFNNDWHAHAADNAISLKNYIVNRS